MKKTNPKLRNISNKVNPIKTKQEEPGKELSNYITSLTKVINKLARGISQGSIKYNSSLEFYSLAMKIIKIISFFNKLCNTLSLCSPDYIKAAAWKLTRLLHYSYQH